MRALVNIPFPRQQTLSLLPAAGLSAEVKLPLCAFSFNTLASANSFRHHFLSGLHAFFSNLVIVWLFMFYGCNLEGEAFRDGNVARIRKFLIVYCSRLCNGTCSAGHSGFVAYRIRGGMLPIIFVFHFFDRYRRYRTYCDACQYLDSIRFWGWWVPDGSRCRGSNHLAGFLPGLCFTGVVASSLCDEELCRGSTRHLLAYIGRFLRASDKCVISIARLCFGAIFLNVTATWPFASLMSFSTDSASSWI